MTSIIPRRELGIFGAPARDLHRDVEGLFRSFFDDFDRMPALAQSTLPMPAFDVTETPETFVIKAEVPGMETKDVDIHIEGDLLTFSGEKKEEVKKESANVHFTERRFGRWSRSFRLPTSADTSRVEARMVNGVLDVTIPKRAESKPQVIKIKPT